MDRVPPYSLEAEQALIGAMLLDKEAIETANELVTETDFYHDTHRTLFTTVTSLATANVSADLITVTERLKQDGVLERIGGAAYISTLANSVPSTANAEHYANIVAEKARLRRVIRVAQEAASLAYEGDIDAVDKLQSGAMDIEAQNNRVEPISYAEVYNRTIDLIEERQRNKNPVTGISTGFMDLDLATSGLQPGELIIVAGRPSMGKSALAQCFGENAAKRKREVLMVILEDTPVNLMQRAIAREARLDLMRLRNGQLGDREIERVADTITVLPQLSMHFLDCSWTTVSTIRTAARRLKRGRGCDLVVVDYLQMIQPGRQRENHNLEIADISQGLKGLAKELEIPVIAVAQLSRGPEARQNKRPMLSDLRESGKIEQDADVVMMLYRDDYYYPDSDRQGITEVIIAKQRNGPVGTVELRWDSRLITFANLAREVSV